MDKTVRLGPIASGNDRPAKVQSDERGRSVWADTVETGQFDLVTTEELRAILDSSDEEAVRSIEEVAAGDTEGVLARNTATGMFRVIDENELQALMANDRGRDESFEAVEELSQDDEEFSLVSTQALRRMIHPDSEAAESAPGDGAPEMGIPQKGGGFDPYNSG